MFKEKRAVESWKLAVEKLVLSVVEGLQIPMGPGERRINREKNLALQLF